MNKVINIIGAGLAGCEVAYQLAKRGYKVNLYEVKKIKKNSVQVSDDFAELVCSNSLRSDDLNNAVGTLKQEMRMLDSLIMKSAELARVPAGGSLAVDREKFSSFITNTLKENKNVTIYDKEVTDLKEFKDQIVLICSGPLTTESLQNQINEIVGKDDFYFFDAVAPIVTKDSINMDIAFRQNRYDKGDSQDYINCPMTKEEYEKFYNELINAEIAIGHLEEESKLKYFEGCMPVEGMAKRGEQTLLFGPLKPQGLTRPDGVKPYAVVQLRQDDAKDSLYNIVGFQTNLKWPEQKRVFSMIPGLENATFIRYGVMHKNNFINSPKVLNEFLQLKSSPNIFFAGQITGVEGYVESCVSGLITGINISRFLENKQLIIPGDTTVAGALLHYIHNTSPINFQPMKANWGILRDLEVSNMTKKQIKENKKKLYSDRALENMKTYIKQIEE
ncbi:methylenetetrahydrofolate--tRNA-(uracil(54)-C(5))-methyltransferase (FADH(2)-oxidizing) TrmFO [Mycoplasma yeatsii]|uniref:methylenetetrahydrofolate--tRNA-(uracil(54)- C(5))-methyltransferase (FADH(2)-oxidizing) TrmFO n=1 Tax=Mycoplasma yeatsii TaxID=51365 RepID=UPI0005B245D2|nr:methylenetetrahydrofolate--tRNA-(uracil(54)-C(5))-methyltransferase (FADH(2)-oxidizing) TrmFO [Mycoplasma yeatsii]AJM71815.1 tRNA:m(5)U-54 methyltransferase [Mycoplasma yeatsii GM274B]